jgi:general secretion pathway protein G
MLKTYESQNLFLPTTEQGLQALIQPPTTDPKPRHWRRLWDSDTVPIDPWGMPYQYRNPGIKHPNGFDLFSFGPDRKEGTDDDIGNWEAK